jgi:hypothetical protein
MRDNTPPPRSGPARGSAWRRAWRGAPANTIGPVAFGDSIAGSARARFVDTNNRWADGLAPLAARKARAWRY